MKKKMILPVLVLGLLAAGGGIYAYKTGAAVGPAMAQDAGGMPMTEVGIVTLQAQSVTFYQDMPGRTSAYRVAEIRPQVSGIITRRLFTEGSDVAEGEQLYQIDPAPYQAAFDSAAADLQKAKANVQAVNAKAARFAELVKIGGVSKQERDDVQASLAQAKADVAIAEAALARAKINLDYTKVFSPIAGRIGQSRVTEGALVTAGQGEALATVRQLDKIYVDVTQSSDELMRLRRQFSESGTPATRPTARLVIDGRLHGEPGVVQFADASVDPGTGTVQLRILFPNPGNDILPGLFVHARLARAHDDNALMIPQQAATRHPGGKVTVFVVENDGTVAIRPVTLGEAVDGFWHVTTGLQPGDRVIVEGTMKVQPGMKVKTAEAAQASAPFATGAGAVPPIPAAESAVEATVREDTPAAESSTEGSALEDATAQ